MQKVIELSSGQMLPVSSLGVWREDAGLSRLLNFIRTFGETLVTEEQTIEAVPVAAMRSLFGLLELSVEPGVDVRAAIQSFGDVALAVDALWEVNGCDEMGKILGLLQRLLSRETAMVQPSAAEASPTGPALVS